MSPPRSLLLVALLASACGPTATVEPDRAPGERKPQAFVCDPTEPRRCGLPFPSNTYTIADPNTATGLRLNLTARAVPLRESPDSLNHADGFSRISPIATSFEGTVSAASVSEAMLVLVAQPGAPDDGERLPLRFEAVPSVSTAFGTETLLIAYPLRPMSPNADHVVVVLDSLQMESGEAPVADRWTRLALGLDEATLDEEARRIAYHAPTRAALERAGIDRARVVRVWDFTTRSLEDPRVRVKAMREKAEAAVASGSVTVAIDSVVMPSSGSVAAVVEGRLQNLPTFRDANGFFVPESVGGHDAPFRVMIPNGTGSYRVVLYGHGTGGNVHDDLFDERLAARQLGKVGGVFYGWDELAVLDTFLSLTRLINGTRKSTSGLMQAMADYSAIERALGSVLGDALSAPMLGTVVNPAVGRRPDANAPIWTGGSLGGTMGLVYSGLSPKVKNAVLNVPGAGWSHFIPGSNLYDLIRPGLQGGYPSAVDFRHALLMSQLSWDDVDGANWTDPGDGSVYLVQMSMGDAVLPNIGSALVATSVRAVQLGAVLEPLPGVEPRVGPVSVSALTQFKVDGDGLVRHGFGSKQTPAGEAAREQISAFLQSVVDGSPSVAVPPLCPSGRCDFSTTP